MYLCSIYRENRSSREKKQNKTESSCVLMKNTPNVFIQVCNKQQEDHGNTKLWSDATKKLAAPPFFTK